jgi:hypothetical protein
MGNVPACLPRPYLHHHVDITFLLTPLTSTRWSLLFASSNNRAESASSSLGNCDTPGRENTSCTSCKTAAKRVDVIGSRSRGCVLTGSLLGLPPPGSAVSPSQTVRAKPQVGQQKTLTCYLTCRRRRPSGPQHCIGCFGH